MPIRSKSVDDLFKESMKDKAARERFLEKNKDTLPEEYAKKVLEHVKELETVHDDVEFVGTLSPCKGD